MLPRLKYTIHRYMIFKAIQKQKKNGENEYAYCYRHSKTRTQHQQQQYEIFPSSVTQSSQNFRTRIKESDSIEDTNTCTRLLLHTFKRPFQSQSTFYDCGASRKKSFAAPLKRRPTDTYCHIVDLRRPIYQTRKLNPPAWILSSERPQVTDSEMDNWWCCCCWNEKRREKRGERVKGCKKRMQHEEAGNEMINWQEKKWCWCGWNRKRRQERKG